jgi:conjugative relaxase-like TrwC/TraI family protein
MLSMRRISLGGGFRYLMDSVATGDAKPSSAARLSEYYAATGTPPGVFLGSGLADLAGGEGVTAGSEVSEAHLRNMLGACCDPVTGAPVGRTPNAGARLPPVAGFDLTFSPVKSVSLAWALADPATKEVIEDCHRRAIAYVLSYAERTVLHARSGTNGIVEEDVTGAVAAAFTHFDSRAGDPQLHTHVVLWNRAKCTSDGIWRTLDSKGLFKARAALSSLHEGVLADYLTEALGVAWEARTRRHALRPRFEIEGVGETLVAAFSHRSAVIEEEKEALVASFVAAHGRAPNGVEMIHLRQQATLSTRPAKSHRSLAEMRATWREAARVHLEDEPVAFVASLRNRNNLPPLGRGDLSEAMLEDAARSVLDTLSSRRSTFGRTNLVDEAHRLLLGVRFASPDERVAVAERVVELAVRAALPLAAPILHHVPAPYLRPDGSSRLHPESRVSYTTRALLEAEARLLEAAEDGSGPSVPASAVAAVAHAPLPGRSYGLGADQALAVERITTSGAVLDLLVGPAGTGKSTTMAGIRAAWEAVHGPGSVVGLAPSAAAAEVLGTELDITCENTAKFLVEHRRVAALRAERRRLAASLARHAHPSSRSAVRHRAALRLLDREIENRALRPGQLVIVDEASLASTAVLDELVVAARAAGAKVLLVGDPAQLGAVDAGGAFSFLVGERGALVASLTEVRRFAAAWEAAAAGRLRVGDPSALPAYEEAGRIVGGSREELLDALYLAWRRDTEAGLSSLMLAPDAASVAELNRRARSERIAIGAVSPTGVTLADGAEAGVGDEVVTRRNDRSVRTGRSFVKNGDRWVVTGTGGDGSLEVRRASGNAAVRLSPDYVAAHVELAYATTTHRAQGRTVDSAHALVSATTVREALYVAATRGRLENRLYVDTSFDADPESAHQDGPRQSPREVLTRVLARPGGELAAHEAMRRALGDAEHLERLFAEYQTLARTAQEQRWMRLLSSAGLSTEQLEGLATSGAAGPLFAALREADARGLDLERAAPRLVGEGALDDAVDVAAVLRARLERSLHASGRTERRGACIVGLLPRASGVEDPELRRGLEERADAIERRAGQLVDEALSGGAAWPARLGTEPVDPARRLAWREALATIAAYRERWGISGASPVGEPEGEASVEQLGHARRAAAAARRASALGAENHATARGPSWSVTPERAGPEL